MNYGFTNKELEHDPARTKQLATAMQTIIDGYPPDEQGKRAHIEINRMYDGLRVRRLTWYTKEQVQRMVRDFDLCFAKLYKLSDGQHRRTQ